MNLKSQLVSPTLRSYLTKKPLHVSLVYPKEVVKYEPLHDV